MERDVRRPSARGLARGSASLALLAVLTGCAGIGQPHPYDQPGINGLVIPTPSPDPADFTDVVDNPWLPLEPGATQRYALTEDGRTVGRMDTAVADGTTEVAGLTATALTTTTTVDDDTVESTAYYAQDDAGNVWMVGLDADGSSWRAGSDGAEAGLAMPADPRLGDGWVSFSATGLPELRATIEEQSSQLVQLRTSTDDDEAGTASRNVYEKGAGLVGVEDLAAGWTATVEDQPQPD